MNIRSLLIWGLIHQARFSLLDDFRVYCLRKLVQFLQHGHHLTELGLNGKAAQEQVMAQGSHWSTPTGQSAVRSGRDRISRAFQENCPGLIQAIQSQSVFSCRTVNFPGWLKRLLTLSFWNVKSFFFLLLCFFFHVDSWCCPYISTQLSEHQDDFIQSASYLQYWCDFLCFASDLSFYYYFFYFGHFRRFSGTHTGLLGLLVYLDKFCRITVWFWLFDAHDGNWGFRLQTRPI